MHIGGLYGVLGMLDMLGTLLIPKMLVNSGSLVRLRRWNGPALCVLLLVALMMTRMEPVLGAMNPKDEYRVDYHKYYYATLQDKIAESLSISNCTVGYEQDLFARLLPPSKLVTSIWGTHGKEKMEGKVYFRTTGAMCRSKKFIDNIKRGNYKGAKGCMGMAYGPDKKPFPMPPRFAATLHPYHPRCDNVYASTACNDGSLAPALVRESDRELHSYPFMVTANKAIVARSGFLALPCGVFGLFASCEGVKWGVPSALSVNNHIHECRKEEGHCPFRKYDKVFVMTQYDDTQIGQFILEALPKLVYNLEFIKANKDMKIHYGFSKLSELPPFVLPNLFLDWLGVGDRLVNGTIYANEVYMPREGGCQDVAYNAWEALHMRETFIRMAAEDPRSAAIPVSKGRVLVITRSPGKFMQNKYDHDIRSWPKAFLQVLLQNLAQEFPELDVEVFADSNSTIMTCQPCQVRLFSNAQIVIGHHGAGLTNTLYMPRGGVVVEVVPFFDSKHAPGVGIFPRVASVIGLHHYLYYPKNETGDSVFHPVTFARETAKFARKVWGSADN
jgi:hypothetical protein